jgi:hypothetical protein
LNFHGEMSAVALGRDISGVGSQIRRAVDLIVGVWADAVIVAGWGLLAALGVYACSITYGIAAGYALPTAALFDLFPPARALYRVSLYLPWALLAVSAIGAFCGWIGILSPHALRERERKLIRVWAYAGFPAIVLIFLIAMSAGGWSGRFEATEYNYMATAGLAPYSDAKSYYGSAFEIGYWGNWDEVASRRPVAAAMRNLVVLLGRESYPGTVIAQAVLLAAAAMFALRSIVAWRGIWVGIALFAFIYGLARPFLLTAMTEPLGLIWSLVSLPYFVEAIRKHSVGSALVGFAGLTIALMIRPGSMWSIPFVALWIPLALATGNAARLKIFAGAVVIVVTIFAFQGVLAMLYAWPDSDTGGNLSYTLCGLAHGSNWGICESLLTEQLSKLSSMRARNALVYHEALRAFFADPSVALHAYVRNFLNYVLTLPNILIEQHIKISHFDQESIAIFLLLLLPGWLWTIIRLERSLLSFAIVIAFSSALSAGFVFADDGTRAMEVTYAFMALLFAIGLSSPASLVQSVERPLVSWRRGAAVMAVALLLLLAIPAIQGAAIRAATDFHPAGSRDDPTVSIVGGAPTITGFVVLPDGTPHPRGTPAIDESTFIALYKSIYTPVLGPDAQRYLPPPPFALVFSPTQNRPDFRWNFVAPPEVLTDKRTGRWQLEIEPAKSPPQGVPFLLVGKATPIE